MSLLLLYRPSRNALSGSSPGGWYDLELKERVTPKKKKPKLSKKFLPYLEEEKLPRTVKGLESWVDKFALQFGTKLLSPIVIPKVDTTLSLVEIKAIGMSWAKAIDSRNAANQKALMDLFLVQQAILEARQIALQRQDEEALILFMLTR